MVDGGGSRDFGRAKGWAFGDPEGFAQLIERLIEATAEYLIAQARAGAEALQLFDSWAGLLPADDFARWCIAPVKEIVRRVKDAVPDALVIGFPRGAGLSYERYGAEAGVDGIGIDPTVSCSWAAATLQPHVTLQGNLDPHRLLVGGAGMENAARSILETLGGGPFIFNLGHGILPATPPENVERLAAIVRGQP
jgi:uroporphyrinogen decarboxylase